MERAGEQCTATDLHWLTELKLYTNLLCKLALTSGDLSHMQLASLLLLNRTRRHNKRQRTDHGRPAGRPGGGHGEGKRRERRLERRKQNCHVIYILQARVVPSSSELISRKTEITRFAVCR